MMEKESLWICCPVCERETNVKVFGDTVLLHFPLCCPWCKKETLINVVQLNMVLCSEPDA